MRLDVEVVLHGSNDLDDIFEDGNAATPDPQAFVDKSKLAGVSGSCISGREDLSVSDLDMDEKNRLQAETIVILSRKYRSIYCRLQTVLT